MAKKDQFVFHNLSPDFTDSNLIISWRFSVDKVLPTSRTELPLYNYFTNTVGSDYANLSPSQSPIKKILSVNKVFFFGI